MIFTMSNIHYRWYSWCVMFMVCNVQGVWCLWCVVFMVCDIEDAWYWWCVNFIMHNIFIKDDIIWSLLFIMNTTFLHATKLPLQFQHHLVTDSRSILMLCLLLLIGVLYAIQNTYDIPFYFGGSVSVIAGLIMIPVWCKHKHNQPEITEKSWNNRE